MTATNLFVTFQFVFDKNRIKIALTFMEDLEDYFDIFKSKDKTIAVPNIVVNIVAARTVIFKCS